MSQGCLSVEKSVRQAAGIYLNHGQHATLESDMLEVDRTCLELSSLIELTPSNRMAVLTSSVSTIGKRQSAANMYGAGSEADSLSIAR